MITDLFRKRFSKLTKGESAKEISNKTDFTPKYVTGLLNGKQYPDIFDLYCIADAYGVTTDYLLGRREEKEPAQAEAGQALEVSTTNNIAQSEEVVKNLTNFPPLLIEFARKLFGEIDVRHMYAHDANNNQETSEAEIEFLSIDHGGKYLIRLEKCEGEED